MDKDAAIRTLEGLYEALGSWDVDAVRAVLHPQFIGRATEGLPLGLGGVYSGPEEMISGLWSRIGRNFVASPNAERFTILADGGLLVYGRYVGHGRKSGLPLDAVFTHIVAFEGDLIVSLEQITDSKRWAEALGPFDVSAIEPNDSDLVTYSFQDGLATIALNRPDARNALGQSMADSLLAVALRLTAQPGLRAVLIKANGPTFTVGGDIVDFAEAEPAEMSSILVRMVSPFHRALTLLDALSVPIVCAVQGAAAGGGLGLLHCSDIVLATEKTRFAAGFAGIGLTGDGGSTWFMPRLIGPKRAAEFYLEGRVLTAVEAEEWGLINHVVAAENLLEEANAVARKLASGPTVALGRARRLLRQSWDVPLVAQLASEGEGIAFSASTTDAPSAVASFLAKETPKFTGK